MTVGVIDYELTLSFFQNLFANVGRRGSAISIRHSLHTVARKSCEESFQSSLMKWRKVRNYIKHANQSVIVESGYQGHCHTSSSHHKEKQKSINASPKRPVNKSQTRWGMLRSKYRSASLRESLKVRQLVIRIFQILILKPRPNSDSGFDYES